MILDRPCLEERKLVVKQCTHQVKYLTCKMPRRCFITGKWLFMKDSVRVTRIFVAYCSPGEAKFTQHFWVDSKQYMLLQLGQK